MLKVSVCATRVQLQSGVVAAETGWPTKLKIFMMWAFTEKVCRALTWVAAANAAGPQTTLGVARASIT